MLEAFSCGSPVVRHGIPLLASAAVAAGLAAVAVLRRRALGGAPARRPPGIPPTVVIPLRPGEIEALRSWDRRMKILLASAAAYAAAAAAYFAAVPPDPAGHGCVVALLGAAAIAVEGIFVRFQARCPRCGFRLGYQGRLALPPRCGRCLSDLVPARERRAEGRP